jgi:hypothetical protein
MRRLPLPIRTVPVGHICAQPRFSPASLVTAARSARADLHTRCTRPLPRTFELQANPVSPSRLVLPEVLSAKAPILGGTHRLHSAQLNVCLWTLLPLSLSLPFAFPPVDGKAAAVACEVLLDSDPAVLGPDQLVTDLVPTTWILFPFISLGTAFFRLESVI